jgi:Transglycosylase-like domain
LPEVAGRRRAVFVALAIAAIVLSLIPFAASSATAPPGINRFLYALGQVESGGNYYARNPSSGAYGKYQILPSNWPVWAKLYVGSSTAKWTPGNQEAVARGKVTALWHWLDTWENTAHWWLTGSGDTNKAHWSSYSRYYVARIMKIYNAVSDVTAAADVMAAPPQPVPPPIGKVTTARVTTTTRRIGETNIGIVYAGRWEPARHVGYADRYVRYATSAGATVTYPFYAKSVAWIGPVGPTRGKAQVSIDGKVVATVDLRRRSFTPRATIFSKSFKSVGIHTLTIKVIGSGRPVAVDEFVITR